MADDIDPITRNDPTHNDLPPPPANDSSPNRHASPSPSKRPLLPNEKTAIDDSPKTKKHSRKTDAKPDDSPDLPLYSPLAGTSRRGSRLVSKFVKSGYATDSAVQELEVYAAYEFETCTFFQEIIPNLFLGRYPKTMIHLII
jgi:hypothetical protein